MKRAGPAFEPGSSNVFRDLGFEHPEEELAKANLILQIVELVRARGLTQIVAARVLALPQPKVSLLLRGQTAGFSTGRLIRLLNRLDQDVEIVVRTKASARRPARLRVTRQVDAPTGRRRLNFTGIV